MNSGTVEKQKYVYACFWLSILTVYTVVTILGSE